jgi:hypothetical protein
VVENNVVTELQPIGGWAIAIDDTATNTVLRNNLCCKNVIYWAGEYMYIHGVGTLINGNKFGDSFNAGITGTLPNMTLAPSSDSINAGVVQTNFTTDINGRVRKGAWDIGAFEYQSGDSRIRKIITMNINTLTIR